MEQVIINWHGPYQLDRIYEHQVAYDFGIYTVSRLYRGKEQLLYIGKTTRDFVTRIKEHLAWMEREKGAIRVRFGTLEFEDGHRFSMKKLSDVESLLITYHSPPKNTMNIQWYKGRKELTVLNRGRRGALAPVVSTAALNWA